MKKTIIVPLTKSPLPQKGRIGVPEKQDWFRGLVAAKNLQMIIPNSFIYIISKVKIKGEISEADLYERTLRKLEVKDEKIVTIRRAYETTVQCKIAFEEALKERADLIIISSPFHYPRVRWICRGKKAKHFVAWGRPRIKEIFSDIVLIFLYPVIDILGIKNSFKKMINLRRKSGKQ